ncbi:MAG: hypothetical protein JOZ48_09350, partial [Acidobacteriaceae bacterium]|nr:hypothetical protein [Acidobacteriaceae bacterium]
MTGVIRELSAGVRARVNWYSEFSPLQSAKATVVLCGLRCDKIVPEGKSMHKLISTFALFAFATTSFAQSPFVGTWKLDTAKTKYTAGDPAKDVTLVVEEQGDNLQVTATGTNADGSPLSVKYTVPVKG